MLLSPIWRLLKENFLSCIFDGFRTSHEMQKIDIWSYDDLQEMTDFEAIREFREHALNPAGQN